MVRVFICYAREDEKDAMQLYYDLKKPGLDSWIDKRSLKGGQNWEVAIKQAIDSSRYFIPVFSSRSITKVEYSQAERKFALEVLDKFPKGGIYIILIRLDDCEIPYNKLEDIHYVPQLGSWTNLITKT